MFSVSDYVAENFDGMLVVADTHGDFASFKRAHDYARSENFYLVSLGDLVDRGPFPFEVVELMYHAMYDGRAGFVVGNHDNKFYRYANGAKVQFSRDGKKTLEDVGEARMADFLRMYCEIIEMKIDSFPQAALFHKFGDLVLVHAAGHHSLWDGTPTTKGAQSRFLVGETNNEVYPDGYPVRLYNWVDEIPMGKTLMVGHDSHPIHNVRIDEPMTVTNKNGGKAIFLDTGCGKGGHMTGAVVLHSKGKFKVDSFMEFK